jgi:response regulator RpfG family c-di-GMP phosphodiesterase
LTELQANQKNFSPAEVQAFIEHPAKSAELVKSFQEIPADVDVIVLQHHERPNGSGFPGKLIFSYISPLSTTFIVAHDLAQDMLSKDQNFVLSDFIEVAKKEYNQGNFKKIMIALERLNT